jgi:hypothetical protein
MLEYICAVTPLWLRLWSAHRIMQNDAIRLEFFAIIEVFGVVMVVAGVFNG